MRIVTGSCDQTAKVWDAQTGTLLLELKGHTEPVMSVAFSPDGSRIITASADRTAKVWDAHSGQELKGDQTLDAEERQYRLAHTQPNYWHYAEGYDAARRPTTMAYDHFAARFYLDRILSLPEHRTTARFQERNDFAGRPDRHCPNQLPPPRPGQDALRPRHRCATGLQRRPSGATSRGSGTPARRQTQAGAPAAVLVHGVAPGHQPAGRGVAAGASLSRPEATRRCEAFL